MGLYGVGDNIARQSDKNKYAGTSVHMDLYGVSDNIAKQQLCVIRK